MSEGFSTTLRIAASGMESQATRLRHVSENIANVDTPGFRGKRVQFETVYRDAAALGEVRATHVTLDQRELPKVYDPSHPMSDEDGFYLGSNVDLVIEIADAREAQRSYEANLRIFDQARQMSQNLLAILKR